MESTELAAGVVDEDVVKRSVLHAQRRERFTERRGHFDELGCGLRAVGGENAVDAGGLRLNLCDAGKFAQAGLPLGVFAIELDLDNVAPGTMAPVGSATTP